MKNLLIALFLITPVCCADWGDVYYCEMTSYSDTSDEGNVTNYKLSKFKFKLDKEQKAMVFGKEGFLSNAVEKLNLRRSFPQQETWVASDDNILFMEGKFLYSYVKYLVTKFQ